MNLHTLTYLTLELVEIVMMVFKLHKARCLHCHWRGYVGLNSLNGVKSCQRAF